MTFNLLYVGMRNRGGPGRIGNLLKKICEEGGGSFSWLHYSKHISAAFNTADDVSIEDCRDRDFDLIIYNQWRSKEIFSYFNGKIPQVLLVMYEDIPSYWDEFCGGLNSIISPCHAVGNHLGFNLEVIHFAVPPRHKTPKVRVDGEKVRFFYPARDGGENDRKGLCEFNSALELSQGKFEVALSLTQSAFERCKHEYHQIFDDPRIELLPELTDIEYWVQMDSCHALLCPSRTSGIELAPLDAIASGVDVIITDIEPMNEYYSSEEVFFIRPKLLFSIVEENRTPENVSHFGASSVHLAEILDTYRPESKVSVDGGIERWERFKARIRYHIQYLLDNGYNTDKTTFIK